MASADTYSLNQSLEDQSQEFPVDSRTYLWCPDANNGAYSNGQIVFDGSAFANSGRWLDFRNSFITVPIVLHTNIATATLGANTPENMWCQSLKNGYHHLIHSINVDCSNNNVVAPTTFTNLEINYRILTTASADDIVNLKDVLGLSKDTTESIAYSANASSNGIGEYNNIINDALFATSNQQWGQGNMSVNRGRIQRMMNTSYDPTNTSSSGYTWASTTQCNAMGKNYTVAQDNNNYTTFILATINLRFIHDLFEKFPVTKGAYIRLTLNTNTNCITTLTTNATGTTYTSVSTASQNGVYPAMISPVTATKGFVVGTTSTGTITQGVGIGKSPINSAYTHPTFQQCRLYVCSYNLSPQYEEMYIQRMPVKKIVYNDLYYNQQYSVLSGATVSTMINFGLSRLRKLLIFPFLAGSINGGNSAKASSFNVGTNVLSGSGLSPMNSPFSSAPGTNCPQATLSNFNVLISGTPYYPEAFQYGFQHYLEEIRNGNCINGGLSLGLSNGLIAQSDWENSRFYVVDLQRKLSPAQDDVAKSVQASFVNNSALTLDFVYILVYEREISISITTGQLITDY